MGRLDSPLQFVSVQGGSSKLAATSAFASHVVLIRGFQLRMLVP